MLWTQAVFCYVLTFYSCKMSHRFFKTHPYIHMMKIFNDALCSNMSMEFPSYRMLPFLIYDMKSRINRHLYLSVLSNQVSYMLFMFVFFTRVSLTRWVEKVCLLSWYQATFQVVLSQPVSVISETRKYWVHFQQGYSLHQSYLILPLCAFLYKEWCRTNVYIIVALPYVENQPLFLFLLISYTTPINGKVT